MSRPFIKRLSDLLFGGPVRATPPAAPSKPLPEILFVPVIFANGRDDDSEGVKAFLEHRPVMLAGRLIGPQSNTAQVEGLNLRFSSGRLVLCVNGHVVQSMGFFSGSGLIINVPPDSKRCIRRCEMYMNVPVQP